MNKGDSWSLIPSDRMSQFFSRPHLLLVCSGLLGAAAVGLGAFGAHGLQDHLARQDLTDVWKTAATYHLVHSVLLFALADRALPSWKWWVLFIGILIFSGTLYLMGWTGYRWLGALTPIGGICLIVGWVSLAFSRPRKDAL